MLPRIKRVETGKVHVNEDVITNDFFLHVGGVEHVEKTSKITMKEFDKMLLHEPQTAIVGTGFKGRLSVSQDVMNAAKKAEIDLQLLRTPDALKKFQELARSGKKVVAHINVNE